MRRLLPLFVSILACGGETQPSPTDALPDASEEQPDADAIDGAGDSAPDAEMVPDAGDVDPPLMDSVELVDGRLALRTQTPAVCAACDDLDGDGLSDEWETKMLEAFRPRVRLAPDEPFITDPDAKMLQIARVF